MFDFSATHAIAVRCAALPPIGERTRVKLEAFFEDPTPIWSDADSNVSVENFIHSIAVANSLDGLTESRFKQFVERAKAVWRKVPPQIVATMLETIESAEDKALADLEVAHVLAWIESHNHPKRERNKSWHQLVSAALAWRPLDEIPLRRAPFGWHAPDIGRAHEFGFTLVPITTTAQLVNSHHQRGVLCDLRLASKCKEGLAAWFYVQPKLRSAQDGWCLIGLERTELDAPWFVAGHYAPQAFKPSLEGLASTYAVRANTAAKLRRFRLDMGRHFRTHQQSCEFATGPSLEKNGFKSYTSPTPINR
jgi:hypothetical protein